MRRRVISYEHGPKVETVRYSPIICVEQKLDQNGKSPCHELNQPIREQYELNQPIREHYELNQPIRKKYELNQPIREQYSNCHFGMLLYDCLIFLDNY